MNDSTNPRVMADNIKELDARTLGTIAEVEALQIYDDAETDTGKKWIDGKTIYRKIISIDALPNTTYQSYAHNISNIDTIIDFYGITKITNDNAARKIGYSGSGINGFIVSLSNVNITTNSDMSGFSAYVFIEYTKAPAGLLAPNPDDNNRNIDLLPDNEEIIGEELKEEK